MLTGVKGISYNKNTKKLEAGYEKSIFVLLLALLLCLCACSEMTAGIADAWESGMNGTAGVTEKHEDENTVEIPATAIRLKVSFGPEFEVVMTE